MNHNSLRSPAERIPESEESSNFGRRISSKFKFLVRGDILMNASQTFRFSWDETSHDDFWKGERQIEFVLPPTIMAITAQLAFHRSSTPIGSPTALIRDGDIEIDEMITPAKLDDSSY